MTNDVESRAKEPFEGGRKMEVELYLHATVHEFRPGDAHALTATAHESVLGGQIDDSG